ncbi:hypothetical protein GCM10010912_31720 [Paenibacillus albidus]|uniref:Uncharacterized protein n=1 Tax=Paenibacillus albidus TaxID=2041023 RepID=A0A917FIK0_9BACL|nr:hypothetical protein [Paenibacillus albidus]GGF84156.1 hypothetical protein GCM10010912_31720 [Paenibacillus albidus]
MGVLSSIIEAFNDIEVRLKFVMFNNDIIVAAEVPGMNTDRRNLVPEKLHPNIVHMQARLLSDYLELITYCQRILENVGSPDTVRFEESCKMVLSYIWHETPALIPVPEDIFIDIHRELSLQRYMISQPYR